MATFRPRSPSQTLVAGLTENITNSTTAKLDAQYRPEFMGGLTIIGGNVLLRKDKKEGMYRMMTKPEWKTVKTTFVPYYAWCNRGQSEMTVWMPIVWQ